MTKPEFIDQIFAQNWLWSYDPKSRDQLPDAVIIEHTLLYADVEVLQQLFSLFDHQEIKTVWEERLLPQARYKKLNTYLAKFFFYIPNAERYKDEKIIEYPRLEQFRVLTS